MQVALSGIGPFPIVIGTHYLCYGEHIKHYFPLSHQPPIVIQIQYGGSINMTIIKESLKMKRLDGLWSICLLR